MARIRRARPADAEALTRIAHAAKRHWGYAERLIRLWEPDLTLIPASIDAQPVYCVADGARILGFYALSADGDRCELEHMWVDPPHLRTGLGARLFEHALATARSMGGSVLRIAADPNAEGFYRRMGARRVGEVPSTPAGRTLPLLVVDLRGRGSPATS